MKKNFLSILLFIALLTNSLRSQNDAQNSFLYSDVSTSIDQFYIKNPDLNFHSSLQPFVYASLKSFADTGVTYEHFHINNHFLRKNLNANPKTKNHVALQFFPQLNLRAGYDLLDNKPVIESYGGAYVRAEVNSNFCAALNIVSGSAQFASFTDTVVQSLGVVPGNGMAYNYDKHNYKFTNVSGYVSYSPLKQVNFQAGKDKFFIGDGYRSVLLSDNATNYPYFKTTVNIWRIQYSVWYAWLKDIRNANRMRDKVLDKYGTFHYLSWNATKNLHISFFENIIWQGNDTNRNRDYDVNYLNPFIFYRPVEYSVGSSDNAMMGLNVSINFLKHFKLYGQVGLDEFFLKEIRARRGWWANKQAYQVGAKYINAFGIKNLMLQGEINYVRPFTYTHGSPQQNYGHYNQPLAHPLGANFYEALGILDYHRGKFNISFKGMAAVIGKDSLSTQNVGQDIFKSYTTRNGDFNHFTGQGSKNNLYHLEAKASFLILPNMNLKAELGFIQRVLQSDRGTNWQIPYVYLGINTCLSNFYRDY